MSALVHAPTGVNVHRTGPPESDLTNQMGGGRSRSHEVCRVSRRSQDTQLTTSETRVMNRCMCSWLLGAGAWALCYPRRVAPPPAPGVHDLTIPYCTDYRTAYSYSYTKKIE